MEFKELFAKHLLIYHNDMNNIIFDLIKRSQEHDLDKLLNKEIYDIYETHFPNLKKIKFGTKEYLDFERDNFLPAHLLHAQCRHHYYSEKNTKTEPNILDLMEAIVDINASVQQYGDSSIDKVMDALKAKKIFEYSLEEYVYNTLKTIGSQNGKNN